MCITISGVTNDNSATMVNTTVTNNTAAGISCKISAAVYDSNGVLKGCGIQSAEIAANSNSDIDMTLGCESESGDTIT